MNDLPAMIFGMIVFCGLGGLLVFLIAWPLCKLAKKSQAKKALKLTAEKEPIIRRLIELYHVPKTKEELSGLTLGVLKRYEQYVSATAAEEERKIQEYRKFFEVAEELGYLKK